MKQSTNHGGIRRGAGRPKGSGKGRQTITVSLSMLPAERERLDYLRGITPRGKYVAAILKTLRKKDTRP